MASSFFDYILIIVSAIKENRRVKKGNEINANLSSSIIDEIKLLETKALNGNSSAAYMLGKMYLDADKVGYDPKKGKYYLEIASNRNDFDANYALAMYYKGYWSYQHADAYSSLLSYLSARDCKTDDVRYMDEVNRVLSEDFLRIDDKVIFKKDIVIK